MYSHLQTIPYPTGHIFNDVYQQLIADVCGEITSVTQSEHNKLKANDTFITGMLVGYKEDANSGVRTWGKVNTNNGAEDTEKTAYGVFVSNELCFEQKNGNNKPLFQTGMHRQWMIVTGGVMLNVSALRIDPQTSLFVVPYLNDKPSNGDLGPLEFAVDEKNIKSLKELLNNTNLQIRADSPYASYILTKVEENQ